MAETRCPYDGSICESSCPGNPLAKGLKEWRDKHPVRVVPEDGLTRNERRTAVAKWKKAIGTGTFMKNTVTGMIGKNCVRRNP